MAVPSTSAGVLCYADTSNSDYGTCNALTLSGSTLSKGAATAKTLRRPRPGRRRARLGAALFSALGVAAQAQTAPAPTVAPRCERQLDDAMERCGDVDDEACERAQTLRDEWQSLHEQVVAAGGLHIIGTERHESRRIDNQLRGRSGRQGDPGKSKFYICLEDDLLRIFAAERLDAIMRSLGIQEGEEIAGDEVVLAVHDTLNGVSVHFPSGTSVEAMFNARRNPWTAASSVAQLGNYTAGIKTTALAGDLSLPQGDGYATLTVSKTGTATWAGKTADGTGFTFATVMAADRHIPLHAMLYKNTGSLQGECFINGTTLLIGGGDATRLY